MNATATVTTINPASRKAIAKAIREANNNFDKMTAAQKRVAIAKDVIAQLGKEKYNAESGTYLQLDESLPSNKKQQLIDIFADPEMPTCTVCARGAMFCSAVRKFNDCTVGNVNGSDASNLVSSNFQKYERKFFSYKQVSLIESAFEVEPFGCYSSRQGKYDWDTGETKWSGVPEPQFPESADFKQTNYCDAGCPHCFESSTKKGKHGDFAHILSIVNQLHSGTELAIGGGNPLDHPFLMEILEAIKSRGVIANLTVNSKHLSHYGDLIDKLRQEKLVWGLGISYNKDYVADILEMMDKNTVIHIIAGVDSPMDILRLPKESKLLVLGYKEHGFGIKYAKNRPVQECLNEWRYWIGTIMRKFHTSFDNLGIKQLNIQSLLSPEVWNSHYMGDDGAFTMFLDAVTETYAVTSTKERMPIGTATLSEMFSRVRKLMSDATHSRLPLPLTVLH